MTFVGASDGNRWRSSLSSPSRWASAASSRRGPLTEANRTHLREVKPVRRKVTLWLYGSQSTPGPRLVLPMWSGTRLGSWFSRVWWAPALSPQPPNTNQCLPISASGCRHLEMPDGVYATPSPKGLVWTRGWSTYRILWARNLSVSISLCT